MENDYRLPVLEQFINKVLNPISNKDKELMERYQRFHAIVYYFEYATGSVRSQESALLNKEADAMVCGNAVAAYVYMHNCFVLLEMAIAGRYRDKEQAQKIKQLKKLYKPLANRAEKLRHAIGAHPEGKRADSKIAGKRTMISTDGGVRIGKEMLHPRKDLKKLRTYLEEMAQLLVSEDWTNLNKNTLKN